MTGRLVIISNIRSQKDREEIIIKNPAIEVESDSGKSPKRST